MKTVLNQMTEWYILSFICFVSWISLDQFKGISIQNYIYALLITLIWSILFSILQKKYE